MALSLKTGISRSFLNLFYHDVKDFKIDENEATLNLFTLKIENKKFMYEKLINELYDCVVPYALSRQMLKTYKKGGGQGYKIAVRKLKEYESNKGELGEILLYCFLEGHLAAPKVLTKLELKTSSEDYVKGSDGIHILEKADGSFELIFGESKLELSLTTGFTNAFKSISNFITRKKNNIESEIGLVESHLLGETFSKKEADQLKKIIIPTKSTKEIEKDNAFAIFLGYDIKFEASDKKLNTIDFRKRVREIVKSDVMKRDKHIAKKIKENKLQNYSFYIFVVPFENLDSSRKKIMKSLN